MKKLIIAILLFSSSVYAQYDLYPFQKTSSNGKVVGYNAYLICSTNFLDTVIPEGIRWSAKVVIPDYFNDDGYHPPVTEQKTLVEFIGFIKSLGDGNVLIKLHAKQNEHGRVYPVSKDDLLLWLSYLGAYGFTIDDLITEKEARFIIASNPEEE